MICSCCKKMLIYNTDNFENFCANCGICLPEKTPFLTCANYKPKKCLLCYKNDIENLPKKNCTYCNKLKNKIKKKYCINCKICPKGHNLGKVKHLKVFSKSKFSSYFKNSFNCDLCGCFKKNKDYVLHCFACGFDVCKECEKSYEMNFFNKVINY